MRGRLSGQVWGKGLVCRGLKRSKKRGGFKDFRVSSSVKLRDAGLCASLESIILRPPVLSKSRDLSDQNIRYMINLCIRVRFNAFLK